MKVLFLTLLISSPYLLAATDMEMKPGLWSIEMLTKDKDGRLVNPMKAIQKALEKMPPAQRQEMMAAMQKMSPGQISSEDMKVCYTQKMINDPSSLASHDKGNCTSKVVTQTPKSIETEFNCKDGATGTAKWLINGPETYTGTVEVNKPKQPKMELTYQGRFLSADCGAVKPLE